MTSQTFILAFDLNEFQIHFITIPLSEENMTSSRSKKGFERFLNFIFESISNLETLCNSMIFMREDKMTSSKYRKYELEV